MNYVGSNRVLRVNGANVVGSNVSVTGDYNNVVGSNAKVVGNNNTVTGSNAYVTGNDNRVTGSNARVDGNDNAVEGSGARIVRGTGNTISDTRNGTVTTLTFGGGEGDGTIISGGGGGGREVTRRRAFVPLSTRGLRPRNNDTIVPAEPVKKQKDVKYVQGPTPDEERHDKPLAPEDEGGCVICLSNIKCCAALPCMHMSYCVKCSRGLCFGPQGDQLKERGSLKCPVCREDVNKIARVHM